METDWSQIGSNPVVSGSQMLELQAKSSCPWKIVIYARFDIDSKPTCPYDMLLTVLTYWVSYEAGFSDGYSSRPCIRLVVLTCCPSDFNKQALGFSNWNVYTHTTSVSFYIVKCQGLAAPPYVIVQYSPVHMLPKSLKYCRERTSNFLKS